MDESPGQSTAATSLDPPWRTHNPSVVGSIPTGPTLLTRGATSSESVLKPVRRRLSARLATSGFVYYRRVMGRTAHADRDRERLATLGGPNLVGVGEGWTMKVVRVSALARR